jgi:hypothetical protein
MGCPDMAVSECYHTTQVRQNNPRSSQLPTDSSFWLFFVIVVLWTIELNCLIQIIINRLSLLLHSKRRIFWLKWGSLLYVGFLNISVFVIWIPAGLQYEPFHSINLIWDRIEKALYLVLDLSLNLYFIYLVKTKLISSGVTKYWTLFKFNCVMIVISISMDILIIAMMQLQNPLLYMQFHPVAYMIKLNIEMSMAHLIGKIARSADGASDPYSGGHGTADEGGVKLGSRARRGGGGRGANSDGFGGSTLANSKHEHRNSRAKFDPTNSQIGDDEEDIRYHAWVSTGNNMGRGRSNGDQHGDAAREGARSPGLSMVGEEDGAPPGYITKDTQVYITSEPVAGDDSQRAPSESSSTRYLKS